MSKDYTHLTLWIYSTQHYIFYIFRVILLTAELATYFKLRLNDWMDQMITIIS